MIELGLVARLRASASLTALVGNRIFPVMALQGVRRPFVTYRRDDTSRELSDDGYSGPSLATLQVNAVALDYQTAKQVADAIRDRLDGFSGSLGGTTVLLVTLDKDQDVLEPFGEGAEDWQYRVMMRCQITWGETIPTLGA